MNRSIAWLYSRCFASASPAATRSSTSSAIAVEVARSTTTAAAHRMFEQLTDLRLRGISPRVPRDQNGRSSPLPDPEPAAFGSVASAGFDFVASAGFDTPMVLPSFERLPDGFAGFV